MPSVVMSYLFSGIEFIFQTSPLSRIQSIAISYLSYLFSRLKIMSKKLLFRESQQFAGCTFFFTRFHFDFDIIPLSTKPSIATSFSFTKFQFNFESIDLSWKPLFDTCFSIYHFIFEKKLLFQESKKLPSSIILPAAICSFNFFQFLENHQLSHYIIFQLPFQFKKKTFSGYPSIAFFY